MWVLIAGLLAFSGLMGCASLKETVASTQETVKGIVPIAKLCKELSPLSDTPNDHAAGCTKAFSKCNETDVTAMRQELSGTLACLGELEKGKVTKDACQHGIGAEMDRAKVAPLLADGCRQGFKDVEKTIALLQQRAK